MATRMLTLVTLDEQSPTEVSAHCNSHGDGHTASFRVGDTGLAIQATGDGTRVLFDWADAVKREAEAAHQQWLAEMAAKNREAAD